MIFSNMEVKLIDHMGTDKTVVNAARVSFNQDNDAEFSSKDEKLIKYLANHNHWSPFAHTSIQFRVKAPIFAARQLVKHQVGGVWNEVSRRYVDNEPEFYFPVWRKRPDASIKQGSGDEIIYKDKHVMDACQTALDTYNQMLKDDIAPELARIVLPQNVMTEWYWTGSLVFWERVCKLRLDSHAQKEVQIIAQMFYNECEKQFPVSWNALMNKN